MILVRKLQVYVFSKVAFAILGVLGVFALSIFLVDLVEQARTVGERAQLSFALAAQLSALKLPGLVVATLPFAVLFGAMLAYRGLWRRSEMSAIRAVGMSPWRFLAPAMVAGVSLGLLASAVIDPLSTRLTTDFESLRDRIVRGDRVETPRGGVWLRQGDEIGQIVINAERVIGRGERFENVQFFVFERTFVDGRPTDDVVFRRRIDAATAELQQGFWQLADVIENAPGAAPARQDYLSLPSNLDRDSLLRRFASPDSLSGWELVDVIGDIRDSGLNDAPYVFKLHQLMALPALLTAMALIGALFSLSAPRTSGAGRLIAIGAGAGLVVFFAVRLSEGFASAGVAPPAVAAWSPALAALFVALASVAYREDG